jgi:hypothetical protein
LKNILTPVEAWEVEGATPNAAELQPAALRGGGT